MKIDTANLPAGGHILRRDVQVHLGRAAKTEAAIETRVPCDYSET